MARQNMVALRRIARGYGQEFVKTLERGLTRGGKRIHSWKYAPTAAGDAMT
jgi:hypothetical protein